MIIDSPIISGSSVASGSLNQFGSVTITGSVNVSGSFTSTGTITAQTLVVQTVTSSTVYSSGSNIFGNSLANTQVLTGSVLVTGSLAVNGSNAVLSNQTSSMSASYALNATSASYANNATTASYANTSTSASYSNNSTSASYANNATTASYALVAAAGGFPYTGSAQITGSLGVTGSVSATSFTGSLLGTSSYADFSLTSSYSLAGSGFPFSGSAVITGSLLVTNLSSSGVSYLVADAAGFVTAQTASAAIKSTQAVTSTAGQTSFNITNGYTTGLVDVYINGTKLSAVEYTDTSGTVITLATGSNSGDTVEFVKYFPASGVTNNALRQQTTFTASAGQTVFSASYTPGLLDIYYNGARLSTSDYTANSGTYFTLATASAASDILDVLVYSYQIGAFSGIGGAGVASQVAYFDTTNSITGSPNFTISGSTITVTGSLIVSGSGTFTNIGPAVFSGSLTSTAGFTGSFSGTATSASYAANADLLDGKDSSIFATTSSNTFVGNQIITGSVSIADSASVLQILGNSFGQASLISPNGALVLTPGLYGVQINGAYPDLQVNGNVTSTGASSYLTGSLLGTASYAANANLLDGLNSTVFATTGSNNFTGVQHIADTTNPTGFDSTGSLYSEGGLHLKKDAYISSSLYIKGNLTVYGTQSVSYITSSQLNISTNIITVNTSTPSIRFGGLAVYDSGSTGLTGSILWDSQNNHWIYTNPSGSSYSGGMFISGPRNTGSMGDEQGTTFNALMKGQGGDHITSSQMIDDGTTVRIPGNLQVTGSLSGSSAVFSTEVFARNGDIQMGLDTTYSLPYMALGWGGRANANNKIYAARDTTDGIIINSATGRGVVINTNGGATNALTIASTGAATFSSTVTAAGITSTGTNAMLSISSSTAGLVVRGGSSIGTPALASGQILIGQTTAYRLSLAYDDNTGYAYIDNLYDNANSNIYFRVRTNGTPINALTLFGTGAATFSSSVTAGAFIKSSVTSGGSVITAQSTATSGEAQIELLGKNSSGTIRSGTFKYDNSDVLRIGTSSNIALQFETNDIVRLTIAAAGAATFSSNITATAFIPSGASTPTNGVNLAAANTLGFSTNSVNYMRLNSAGNITIINPGDTSYTNTIKLADYRDYTSGGGVYIAGTSNPGVGSSSLEFGTNQGSSINCLSGAGRTVNFYSLGTGTVYSNGGTLTNTNPSDSRLKDNITNLTWGLKEILQLTPVSYTWKDDTKEQGNQYGFIAQDVQKVMPELVKEFTIEGDAELGIEDVIRLGLEKDGIYTALVKAIQEQQTLITALQEKLERNNII